jgi:hypothetical protein
MQTNSSSVGKKRRTTGTVLIVLASLMLIGVQNSRMSLKLPLSLALWASMATS